MYGNFFGQSSLAGHALAYASNTVKIPADVPMTVAAPLGCGVQTGAGTVLNVLRPAPGETVAVFGAGAVGLSAVMAAVALRCEVVVVEPVPARRELALSLGAAAAVDPATGEAAPGSAHHAIDTTGRAGVIDRAVRVLRRRGTLALVGMGGRAELDIMTVMTGGITVRGVIEGDADPATFLPQLIDLYRQGKLPLEKIVVEYPFEEVETAARDAAAGLAVKPVLIPGGA